MVLDAPFLPKKACRPSADKEASTSIPGCRVLLASTVHSIPGSPGTPWVSRRRGQGDTCLKRGTSTAFASISSSALTQAGGCAWAERRASPGPHRAQPAPSVTGRGTVLQRGAQTSRYEAQRGRCGRQACAARLSCSGVWEEQNFCSPFL